MTATVSDSKLALLPEDLREFARTLDTITFPKTLFCVLCGQPAYDAWKLLCCNKALCADCHAKLAFPTSCPSCEHSPLEGDSCIPNKALRNTMRIWLQKQKKKEDAKAATQQVGIAPEVLLTSLEASANNDDLEKSNTILEGVPAVGHSSTLEPTAETGDGQGRLLDQPESNPIESSVSNVPHETPSEPEHKVDDDEMQNGDEETGQNNGVQHGNATDAMVNQNQSGFGFNSHQSNYNNGMGFNGMNSMNGMPNAMGPGGWNMNNMHALGNMNHIGYGMNNMHGMSAMPNGMFNGFGGNMGMGMNDMFAMNYGGGFGNGWNGMGGENYGGYNNMSGYNQPGAYPGMMNQFSRNNYPNQNRFGANSGSFQRSHRNGSIGQAPKAGHQNNLGSRPVSRSGSSHQRDSDLPNGVVKASSEDTPQDKQADLFAEPSIEGKEATASTNVQTVSSLAAESNEALSIQKDAVGEADAKAEKGHALNPIQTVDSEDADPSTYNMSMQNLPDSLNPYMQSGANSTYDSGNGYGLGSSAQQASLHGAYGAATVLTGEPRGLGVEGAPTGPRAMREGRPNTGFASRANNAQLRPHASNLPPTQNVTPGKSTTTTIQQNKDSLKGESPRSRSRSFDRGDGHADRREQSQTPYREIRDRSRTPDADDHSRRKERRRHRSSRYDDGNDMEERDEYDYDHKDRRSNRSRSTSVDSRYRSRRDKDKERHRSSRSQRDRSREHRRRHRSRSYTLDATGKYDDESLYKKGIEESRDRRKSRSDRDKYRDREKKEDRASRDRKEREDNEKYRSREKDDDRRRRREREFEDEERDYDEDEKYRSSRRSRKDRDRGYERDKDRPREVEKIQVSLAPARSISPPLNAPTGPSADNFSIRGASRPKASRVMGPLPTGPRSFQPPKGPSADKDKSGRKSSLSTSANSSKPVAPQDHYAAEREKNARERAGLTDEARSSASHVSSTRPTTSSKRTRDETEGYEGRTSKPIPTGPSHRDKRRRSGEGNGSAGGDLASQLTRGLRKKAGGPRRGGIKNEGDTERELERVERERDSRRW